MSRRDAAVSHVIDDDEEGSRARGSAASISPPSFTNASRWGARRRAEEERRLLDGSPCPLRRVARPSGTTPAGEEWICAQPRCATISILLAVGREELRWRPARASAKPRRLLGDDCVEGSLLPEEDRSPARRCGDRHGGGLLRAVARSHCCLNPQRDGARRSCEVRRSHHGERSPTPATWYSCLQGIESRLPGRRNESSREPKASPALSRCRPAVRCAEVRGEKRHRG